MPDEEGLSFRDEIKKYFIVWVREFEAKHKKRA
jgi:hypothetical protein